MTKKITFEIFILIFALNCISYANTNLKNMSVLQAIKFAIQNNPKSKANDLRIQRATEELIALRKSRNLPS